MSYYLAEIRFNRNKRSTSEKKGKKKKRLILTLFTLTMISFLISASVMLFSVTACLAPEIVCVMRTPETPNYDQQVKISVNVIKGASDIASVILRYQIGSSSWINVTMSLQEELRVATIPAQPYNTTVNYKVYASDTDGRSDVSELYSYLVGDFVAPVISNINRVPDSPNPYEYVKVSAKVTEPSDASGIKKATLWFTAAGRWSSINMTLNGGLWAGVIPGLRERFYVRYYVEAFDNAGNSAKSPIFSYSVAIPNIKPVAIISKSATTVYTGEIIDFSASDSYDPDGTIVSYFWDFGDGNSDSVAVSHSYLVDGLYIVTLTVVDDDGASDSATALITVKNRPPVADINTSTTILDKEEIVVFNASESYDLDGNIVSYSWDFGDGTRASGVITTHSYSVTGQYIVILTVTDDDGATDTATVTKTVSNQSPVATFTKSAHIVDTNEVINFVASASYDPDGTIVNYLWDFGDGTTGIGVSVEHSYPENGVYIVTLTVIDDNGATDSTTSTETVLNQSPVASFTESAHTVETREFVSFDASDSYDPDGTIVSYAWDFGDGNSAAGIVVTHTYVDGGSYLVTLILVDNDGATDSAHDTKTVVNRPPVAAFTESAHRVDTSEVINFDASASYDLDGTIVNYLWDFGDGATATGVEVEHAYSDDGTYTVTLTVTDDDNATDTDEDTKTVANLPPVAFFTESSHKVNTSEVIYFDASDSYDVDGTIVTYEWEFGDGTLGTGISTQHSYHEAGNYSIKLTVTDDDRTSASTTDMMTVQSVEDVENQSALSLSVLLVIILGVMALTATILYGLFIRRKQKKKKLP